MSSPEGSPEDMRVVARLRRGDSDAFALLFGRYDSVVRGLAYRMGVTSPEDGEDIVQEVFLRVHESLPRYREGYALPRWILGIARNVTRMWLRRKNRHPVRFESVEPVVQEAALEKEPGAEARDLLTRFPDRIRDVIEHRYLKGKTYREVAHALGITEDQVDAALRKAKTLARLWHQGQGSEEQNGISR